jgi:hypothetical protein
MDLNFLPAAIRPLLRKALSPSPEERFPSCLEFILALRECLLPFVDDIEAKQYLIDVQDGGKWEKPPPDPPKTSGLGETIPMASPASQENLNSQQKSDKNRKKTRLIRVQLTRVLATAALTLAPWYILAHYLERIATRFRWVVERGRDSTEAWRGKVILFALVVSLAVVPFVILAKRTERLSPILSPWFESERKELLPTVPEEPSERKK